MNDKKTVSTKPGKPLSFERGAHILSIYATEEEHSAALIPFIAEGLRRGERVIYIAHSRSEAKIKKKLRAGGLNPEELLAAEKLIILYSRDVHTDEGLFPSDALLQLLGRETGGALSEGCSGLRVAAEMEWALGGTPKAERLFEYAAALDGFLPGKRCSVLCLYDRRKFPADILLDVLKLHPAVFAGGRAHGNFFYGPEKGAPTPSFGAGRAEDALRESNEFIAAVMENLPLGLAVNSAGPQVNFYYMNDKFAEIYRTTREELMKPGAFWEAVYEDPVFREKIKKRVEEDCASGDKERMSWEDVPVSREGEETTYISASNIPVPGKDVVISTVRDVTKRKLAEDALRASEKRFRDIAGAAGEYLWELDEKNRYIYASPRMAEVFGRPVEDILGSTPFDFMPAEEVRRVEKIFGGLAAERKLFRSLECMLALPSGEVKWESVSGVPVFSENGKFAGYRGTALDITQRKKAEEENRVLLERMQLILDATNTGINIIDPEYNMVYIDPGWQKKYGDYRGRKCYEYFMGRSSVCPSCRAHAALETGKTAVSERRFPKEAGRCVQTTSFPFRDESGGFLIAQVNTDITLLKKSERRISYLNTHDALTGLRNRTFAERELRRLDARENMPLSVMVFDVNGLRLVNDSYGQSVGDALLLEAAKTLKKTAGRKGITARWGADEFIIIKPKTSRADARKILSRIREAAGVVSLGPVPLSLSSGFAVKKTAGEKMSAVLKEAEGLLDKNKLQEGKSVRSSMINTLLSSLEVISNETNEHALRLREIALRLGRSMKLPQAELDRLSLLVALHDIGKIAVPETVLTKKDRLTGKEWEIIKKHSEIGYKIASATKEFSHVAEEILKYHERWDGSGYPTGARGEDIPVLARIGAIVDAFDAMTNDRPYRKAMSACSALAELKKCSGTQFDPDLVDMFISLKKA